MKRFFLPCATLATALIAGNYAVAAERNPIDYAHQNKWRAVLDHAQSPIDIRTEKSIEAADNEPGGIQFWNIMGVEGDVEDNGHAVQFNTHSTEAMIRGRHFQLTQVHFHAPSEHTIDGKHSPLEGHFVFKAQDGRLAVLGVMYKTGAANPAIQDILEKLPSNGHNLVHHRVNALALLPKQYEYYHYLGSLTTPPLTQNVEWYVMKSPVLLSQQQLVVFREHHQRNNRDIQPLHNRPIVHYAR